jgi:hypothetical protein
MSVYETYANILLHVNIRSISPSPPVHRPVSQFSRESEMPSARALGPERQPRSPLPSALPPRHSHHFLGLSSLSRPSTRPRLGFLPAVGVNPIPEPHHRTFDRPDVSKTQAYITSCLTPAHSSLYVPLSSAQIKQHAFPNMEFRFAPFCSPLFVALASVF